MNTLSTDIERDDFDLPDDPKATEERMILLLFSLVVGIVFGIFITMAYFSLAGKPCSAAPYCSIHKIK